MLAVSPKMKVRIFCLTSITTLLFCVLVPAGMLAETAAAGRILVHLDGIARDGEQPYAFGWACQQGERDSIQIRIYADDGPNDSPKGTFLQTIQADGDSDPAVARVCGDQIGKHRFKAALRREMFPRGKDRKLFLEGLPVPASSVLSGNYKTLATHPRVFNTRGDLEELAARSNVSGSYSAKRFRQLAEQIARDLAARNDWDATYSGCDAGVYQYAFSYEPQNGNETKLRADLQLPPGSVAPAGAAVVASRLALYAALVKAGAVGSEGAPNPEQAAALAKQILVAWSEHGFRDQQGHIRTAPSQYCNSAGSNAEVVGLGLALARGMLYSVQAQDLLMYLGSLNDAEAKQAFAFHAAMYGLLQSAFNSQFEHHAWGCDHYGNHQANQIAALLALARLADDQKQFEAILYGRDPAIRILQPWTDLFSSAIYGEADAPHSCYFNTGSDGFTSHPFFSTSIVAPGEVDDRFRNKDTAQGVGYAMFTLERLVDSAEILRLAGYDSYGYRGQRKQSIEAAVQYYACFAHGAGFNKVISPQNSGSCPDAPQYYGKIVNGVDRLVTIAAYRFPTNNSLADVEAAAKVASSSGVFSLDSIFFGRWKD